MNTEENKNILIIDDDITALDIVSYLFEDSGFVVNRFADGASAIEYVKGNSTDVLLVDLMMPGIDGIETIKEVRLLKGAKIPIIAFTAVDDPSLHEAALSVGCNKVLTKPCPPEKLVREIKELFVAS